MSAQSVRERQGASALTSVDFDNAGVALQRHLSELLGRIRTALGVDTVAVLLLDDSRKQLVARAAKGLEEAVEAGVTVPVGKGFAGRVVAEVRPIVIADLDNFEVVNPILREKGIRSMLGVPLMFEGLVLGVLHVGSLTERIFTGDDIRLLELTAERVALPLAQAHLFQLEHEARTIAESGRSELEFLAEASALLSSSLDYETTLDSVARLAVPGLADWCVIDLEHHGVVRRVAVAHADPAQEEIAQILRRDYSERFERPEGTGKIMRTGAAELSTGVSDEYLQEIAIDERELEILRGLRLRSNLLVPLVARGRTIGVLTLATAESGRIYRESDLWLAEELATRVALAVDNARLFSDAVESEEQMRFLAEAGTVLASSLDYVATLQTVARLAVPDFADWCIVDVVEDEDVHRVAVAAADEGDQRLLEELRDKYPPRPGSRQPAGRALSEGRPVIFHEFSEESLKETTWNERHFELMRELQVRSALAVPLVARGHTVGALTFAWSHSGKLYEHKDIPLAEQLAGRVALAVDNARLYREAEERAEAALALEHVGDGVFRLDREGIVRLWNPAAEAVTGLPRSEVIGRRAIAVIPGWEAVAGRVPVAASPAEARQAETLPLEVGERELWLSLAGVALDDGTVYTFRDLTEERALEKLRSDFVATISHELRTPLASVYGAALTLTRDDIELDDERRSMLLDIVSTESERLARIVNDVLLTSRLDSETLALSIESCDPTEAIDEVIAATSAYVPEGVELVKTPGSESPRVAADREQLRQILDNLLDNAVKYGPEQGTIEVGLGRRGRWACIWVRDDGRGIPAGERDRVFEKFYRLDPDLLEGVGGTGLGLYIARELVRRMGGRIWVESEEGSGATFFFELPLADVTRAEAPA